MKFILTNRKQTEYTFQVAGSYKRVTLLAGESVTLEGKKKDYDYYRSRGLKVVTDSSGVKEKVVTVKEPVTIEPEPELTVDDIDITVHQDDSPVVDEFDNLLTDDDNLSAESVYTFDFLTKNKAIAVLKARNIDFDDTLSAKELKDLVIESNPS